jgi:hypothetical protein
VKSRRTRLVLLFALAFLLVSPHSVRAVEVLTLDGGSITATRISSFADVNVTGPHLAIVAAQQTVLGSSGYGIRSCSGPGPFGCAPGTVLQIGGGGVGSDFSGSITLDGAPHGIIPAAGGPQFDSLILFAFGTVLIPDFGSIESVVLAAPFVLTGTLYRTSRDCFPFNPSNPACSGSPSGFDTLTPYELYGQGTFHGELNRVHLEETDFWLWDSARFDLQPTPEPATLFLFGTSTAGLGLARWFRRGRQHAA